MCRVDLLLSMKIKRNVYLVIKTSWTIYLYPNCELASQKPCLLSLFSTISSHWPDILRYKDENYNRNTTKRKTITFVKWESNFLTLTKKKKFNFAAKLDAATLAGARVYVYGQRSNFFTSKWNRIFQISLLIWTSKIPKMKLQTKEL